MPPPGVWTRTFGPTFAAKVPYTRVCPVQMPFPPVPVAPLGAPARYTRRRRSSTSRFSIGRQENPLMYIDVYFRILHAYTIIYSIYYQYRVSHSSQAPAPAGGVAFATEAAVSEAPTDRASLRLLHGLRCEADSRCVLVSACGECLPPAPSRQAPAPAGGVAFATEAVMSGAPTDRASLRLLHGARWRPTHGASLHFEEGLCLYRLLRWAAIYRL